MALIELQDASVAFPVFTGKNQSFRSRVVQAASGGRLAQDPHGRTVAAALNSITFRIASGERVGLIGPNGAGKSTLLRVLSRIYRPTTGAAKIEGTIGTLMDISLGINPEATGRQNIFLRGRLLGISKPMISGRMDEIIEFADLGEFIDMPVRTYSSGMQMRLSLAVSTIFEPQILIMDEWLSVGDEAFRDKAEKRLQSMVSASEIMVIASHSRQLLENTCERGILLQGGHVVADGPMTEIAASYFKGPA